MPLLLLYLLILNPFTFMIAVWDKRKAKKGGRRVPEKTLLLLAFVGGALGLLAAMYTVRHKTRKAAFKWGVPCMLLLHIGLAVFLIVKGILHV